MTIINGASNIPSPVDMKLSAAENGGSTMLVESTSPFGWKGDLMQVTLRSLCMVTSVIAMSFMVTASQASSMTIYGFMVPVVSKWSFSNSFEFLVGVTAAVAAHSLFQVLVGISRLLRNSPIIPSRIHAWILFAGDQVFAYVVLSAGSAASGTTNLNRAGMRHTPLPNFCKPLQVFCDHVAVSIAFTLISCILLAASAVQEVIWLSNSNY